MLAWILPIINTWQNFKRLYIALWSDPIPDKRGWNWLLPVRHHTILYMWNCCTWIIRLHFRTPQLFACFMMYKFLPCHELRKRETNTICSRMAMEGMDLERQQTFRSQNFCMDAGKRGIQTVCLITIVIQINVFSDCAIVQALVHCGTTMCGSVWHFTLHHTRIILRMFIIDHQVCQPRFLTHIFWNLNFSGNSNKCAARISST